MSKSNQPSAPVTGQEVTIQPNLSLQIKHLGKELLNYNLLTPFPLSDGLLIAYAEKLVELTPDIQAESVRIAINSLILGFSNYDKALGIQNLRNALYDVKNAKETLERQNKRESHYTMEEWENAKCEVNEKTILKQIERSAKWKNKMNSIY